MAFDDIGDRDRDSGDGGRDRDRTIDVQGFTGGPEARKKLVPWLERVRKSSENDAELEISLVHLDGPRENPVWSSQLAFDEDIGTFVDELVDEAESRSRNRGTNSTFVVRVEGTRFSRQFEIHTRRTPEQMDPWLSDSGFRGTELRDVIADLLSSKENDRRLIYQLVRDAREDSREMVASAQRTVEMYQRVDLENRALSAKMMKNEKIIDFQIEEKRNKRQQHEKMFGFMSMMGLKIVAEKLGIALPMPMMGAGPGGGGSPGGGGGGGGGGSGPRIPIEAKLMAFMQTMQGSDIKLTDEQQQIFASIVQDVMTWQAEQQARAQQEQAHANTNGNGNGNVKNNGRAP